jgi:phosphate transport system ATP-binding protein
MSATAVEAQAKDVEARNLNLYYGDFLAVKDVNVRLPSNRITALIGSSGCGKSTFLRAVNRMHELIPAARVEGDVIVGGEDVYGEDVDPTWVRSQIGMVFQQPNPFPTMSIYDNVVAGLKLNAQKRPKKEFDAIVEGALNGVHLWDEVKDRLNKSGSGLSGGQQQRLCIARATAMQPEVLLMDEPCSALDPISTIAIEKLMRELKVNFTIVIVTHNMQQATRVSDYTGFFNLDGVGQPGHLVEFGETNQIFNNPTEQATKEYVSGNFG